MAPVIDLGIVQLPAYFTLLTLGLMAAVLLGWWLAGRTGFDQRHFLDAALVLIVFGVLGARLLHVLADGGFWDYVHLCTEPERLPGRALSYGLPCREAAQCIIGKAGARCDAASGLCYPAADCLRVFKLWQGGLAYYGGPILALPAVLLLARWRRFSFWALADLCAVGVPLGLTFGRIGCVLSGCCFGAPTRLPWALRFPLDSPAFKHHVELGLLSPHAAGSLPVHPAQLYEAAGAALIFGLCLWLFLRRRPRPAGQLFLGMLLAYALLRFVVEFWRDDARGLWFGDVLSTSQLIGLPIVLATGALLVWRARRAEGPAAPPAVP